MSKNRTHFRFDERQCNCGDSYCGDCRTIETVIACKRARYTANSSTKVADVTCESCAKTPAFQDALRAALVEARKESEAEVRAERDKYKKAIDDLVSKCNAMQRGNPKTYYIEAPTGTLIHRSVVIDVLSLLGVHVERGY